MILLTGATGKTGQKILALLQSRDIPARIIVRDPAKVAALNYDKLDICEGDLKDEATLSSALDGIERAFLLMANTEDQSQLETQFIDTAKKAGVSHIIKMSAIGADNKSTAIFKRYHGEVEKHLQQSGLMYTNIQPNFFMDNLLHCAQTIKQENKFYLPLGSGKTGIVDLRDVAEVIVAALTEPGHENKTYLITGPEILSFSDIAEVFSNILNRTISYINIPAEQFKTQLLGWGGSEWFVDAALQNFACTARGESGKITNTFNELTGKTPHNMEQFVRDYMNIFS